MEFETRTIFSSLKKYPFSITPYAYNQNIQRALECSFMVPLASVGFRLKVHPESGQVLEKWSPGFKAQEDGPTCRDLVS